MTTKNHADMMQYCDELTKDGSTLSVTWNGGGDEGYFDVKLNDEVFRDDHNMHALIIDLVEDCLAYGSFAGEFSAQGKVTYNRETKCFEGTDICSYSKSGSKECDIPVRITKDIWFDRLEIQIQTEEGEDVVVKTMLMVTNGPLVETHAELEGRLVETIREKVLPVIENIDDLSGIWEEITINHADFMAEGNDLISAIKKLEYEYYHSDYKDIEISLTN